MVDYQFAKAVGERQEDVKPIEKQRQRHFLGRGSENGNNKLQSRPSFGSDKRR